MSSLAHRAFEFARKAHESVDQKRKYTGQPYILHPIEVASIVSFVTEDQNVIAAAYLHDVVEDTGVTLEEISQEFGDDVALLVSDLTDVSKPSDGNRAKRKQIDLEHTAKASPRAKTIKLADLISNAKSIVKHDPDFAKVYLKEMTKLMKVLTEGNGVLYAMCREIIDGVSL